MNRQELAQRAGPLRLAMGRARRTPLDAWYARHYDIAGDYRRIYLHHIRKTAGTSLNRTFMGIGGEDPLLVEQRMERRVTATRTAGYVIVGHDQQLLERGHYFFGWSHREAWSVDLPPRTFTVTVLRDPAARVVSLYRYFSDRRADVGVPGSASRAEREMAADGFDRFLDRLPREQLLKQLQMFSPTLTVEEAADRVRDCAAWFMTEQFDEGVVALGRRLGLELPPRRDRRSVGHDDLVGSRSERLMELLAPEYELLDRLHADPGGLLAGGPAGSAESGDPAAG